MSVSPCPGCSAVYCTLNDWQFKAISGPFAELKKVLASLAVIDVASHDRALEIVSRIVDALGEPVEIRPIMGEDFAAWPRTFEHPGSWLIRIGYRKLVDLLRADQARRRREQRAGIAELVMQESARQPEAPQPHPAAVLPPALSTTSQGGAHAARRGRPDHRRDRARVRGGREHHGSADQPGQAAAGPGLVHPADRRPTGTVTRH